MDVLRRALWSKTSMSRIKYTYKKTGELRKHYLGERDVEILLGRLPPEVWARLRAVHFNDKGLAVRRIGYVSGGRREIAICALPPNVSLARYLDRRSPRQFGAIRAHQWPETAVRRFMLYDVFLHELGHLQIVDPKAQSERRRFASQTKAQEFADEWRASLWAEPFAHDDPIHNPPSATELEMVERELQPVAECQQASVADC
jgi:hypothetical protein